MQFPEPTLTPLEVLLERKRTLVFLAKIVRGTCYREIHHARRQKWHRLEAVHAVQDVPIPLAVRRAKK